MTPSMKYALVSSAAVLAFALASVEAQQASGSFSRTLSVDQPIELDVATGSGSIEIRPGRSDEVTVVGRISARSYWSRSVDETEEIVRRIESDPPIELTGDTLRVGYLEDDDERRNVSISYEIVVPERTPIRSRTGSGSQRISGIDASVEASTGSGSIVLTDIGAAVSARTGSGSVEASGVVGDFTARTGSGSVRVARTAPGDVRIETGSGSSAVSGVEGALRVRTGSGRIEAEGVPLGLWELEAGSGSITVRLPDDASFDVDARSGAGGVRVEHPVRGTIRRGRIDGSVRGGGPELRMRTGSGSLAIL